MRDVVIDQKGCRLSFDRQVLILHHDSFHRPIMIPFGQIQSLTIVSGVELSSTLLTKLAYHNIAVVILAGMGATSCFVQGKWHAGVTRRQAQYAIVQDNTTCRYWANVLVRLKIHRQMALLRRLVGDSSQSIGKLQAIKQTLMEQNIDLPSLRGYEGSASAIFFSEYRQVFDDKWQFYHRNRRPPLDPINTILSLSYTLLQAIYEKAVYVVGFDPYLGVLHEVSYGRASLACDFAELQRCEIEYWVWQLFDNEVLTLDDFSLTGKTRPCELLKAGRNRFYQAFNQIKPILQKTALHQVWLWQRRITHSDDTLRLDFVSEMME